MTYSGFPPTPCISLSAALACLSSSPLLSLSPHLKCHQAAHPCQLLGRLHQKGQLACRRRHRSLLLNPSPPTLHLALPLFPPHHLLQTRPLRRRRCRQHPKLCSAPPPNRQKLPPLTQQLVIPMSDLPLLVQNLLTRRQRPAQNRLPMRLPQSKQDRPQAALELLILLVIRLQLLSTARRQQPPAMRSFNRRSRLDSVLLMLQRLKAHLTILLLPPAMSASVPIVLHPLPLQVLPPLPDHLSTLQTDQGGQLPPPNRLLLLGQGVTRRDPRRTTLPLRLLQDLCMKSRFTSSNLHRNQFRG